MARLDASIQHEISRAEKGQREEDCATCSPRGIQKSTLRAEREEAHTACSVLAAQADLPVEGFEDAPIAIRSHGHAVSGGHDDFAFWGEAWQHALRIA